MPVNFSGAVKAPPRKRTGTTTPATIEPPRTVRQMREEGLNGIAQLGQGIALAFQQYADSATIGTYGPGLSRELAALADNYDILAKPIDLVIQVGPFGALLTVLMPFALQMLTNHRIVNAAGVMGVMPPETLDVQMRSQIMRMQAEALKAQALAEKEMKAAQAELAGLMNGGSHDGTPVQG